MGYAQLDRKLTDEQTKAIVAFLKSGRNQAGGAHISHSKKQPNLAVLSLGAALDTVGVQTG
jgi:hypothetical protein